VVVTRLRSLIKALTYRISGSFITGIITYFATDKIELALGIGFFDIFLKIIFYYLHERLWDKIQWGRH
jgi:uncharacterized membrane protein